jgi:hypothetical protein
MEVPKVPNEEMVDYEATPKTAKVNVVVLFADYYIVGDDSMVVEFNFVMESVVFQKPGHVLRYLVCHHVFEMLLCCLMCHIIGPLIVLLVSLLVVIILCLILQR